MCNILNFEVGNLSFKYLEVPMVSTKITKENCKLLLEKIIQRITSWKSKSFNYTRRLMLVKAIHFSIQVYWSFLFILPSKMLVKTNLNKHKANVTQNKMCVLKEEEILELITNREWNKETIIKHL